MPTPFAREKAMAQYKTIALELIQEEYPALHERLRASRSLLQAVNGYARDLKTSHEAWKDRLAEAKPGSDPSQTASEALELAIEDLRKALHSGSPTDEEEGLSLDNAMSFIRRHTSSA
jgi:hypothetical protein